MMETPADQDYLATAPDGSTRVYTVAGFNRTYDKIGWALATIRGWAEVDLGFPGDQILIARQPIKSVFVKPQ